MVSRGGHLRLLQLMQLKAEQHIECGWHLCLRWFYEFGASRLAIRGQPLPSKPVIPVQPYYTSKVGEGSRLKLRVEQLLSDNMGIINEQSCSLLMVVGL